MSQTAWNFVHTVFLHGCVDKVVVSYYLVHQSFEIKLKNSFLSTFKSAIGQKSLMLEGQGDSVLSIKCSMA